VIAHKNNTSVRIRLSPEQIEGKVKYKILLNKTQYEKIDESKKQKKGFVLESSYEQMKTGGF